MEMDLVNGEHVRHLRLRIARPLKSVHVPGLSHGGPCEPPATRSFNKDVPQTWRWAHERYDHSFETSPWPQHVDADEASSLLFGAAVKAPVACGRSENVTASGINGMDVDRFGAWTGWKDGALFPLFPTFR